ncbi:hypothetical protein LTR64_000100 [Lithohypha guttulata]|uniref:uncharacterized protein n=1 Tax=Lithohypha guttulata TaxID=1690604 RepID=UPI002DDE6385|nr:hypothetical protein LTR51_007462 [Lithohypha guttulata]
MTHESAQDITTTSRAATRRPSANGATGYRYSDVYLTEQATAHLGDVNVYPQYYANHTAQGSQFLLRPTIVIPFRRDVRDFVERNILKDIAERWSHPAARVAIVGLGGVGKTQIAIEHAYRCRDADPNMWIFWVHASSAERFQEGYKDIAATLQLTGWDNPQADILSMVQRWLSNEHNGRWTMVLDNADDSDVIFGLSAPRTDTQIAISSLSAQAGSTNRSLSTYLPVSPNGSILITSRNRRIAEGLVDYSQDILELTSMTVEEAASLLSKKLGHDKNGTIEDDHICLVRELDCIPLAVSQSAAYILQRAPRMDVASYLQKLRSTDTYRDRLLAVQGIRGARRDEKSSKSILTTWHISFQHIQTAQPSAARLLALMSLFDRQTIPEDLLVGRYSIGIHSSWKPPGNQDSFQSTFEDDISILKAYSLINSGASDNLFTMHRLVQYSTQKWLQLTDSVERSDNEGITDTARNAFEERVSNYDIFSDSGYNSAEPAGTIKAMSFATDSIVHANVEMADDEESAMSDRETSVRSIQRVIRSQDDIQSRLGLPFSPAVRKAEVLLLQLLCEDELFAESCRLMFLDFQDSSLLDSSLREDITELLKYYFLDLRQAAITRLEHAASTLFRSRFYRERIATNIVRHIRNQTPLYVDDEDENATREKTSMSREDLNLWLMKNAGFGNIEYDSQLDNEQAQSTNEKRHGNPNDHTAGEGAEDQESSLHDAVSEIIRDDDLVGKMEYFLLKGQPFHSLVDRANFHTLRPQFCTLGRVLMTFSKDSVSFKTTDQANWYERCANFVSRHSEIEWGWWPLPLPKTPLHPSDIRISWICVSPCRRFVRLCSCNVPLTIAALWPKIPSRRACRRWAKTETIA